MANSSSSSVVEPSVSPERVRELAAYASLPLAPGREIAVAAILSAWVPEANALSAKISHRAYQTLVPATVFAHPGTEEWDATA